jgi:hypothetical protein
MVTFLGSLSQFGTTYTDLKWWLSLCVSPNMMHRWHVQECQVLRVLEPALRMKAQVDSNSRGQKDFICREEKKDCILGNAGGPGNRWSHRSRWGVGFIAYFSISWGQRCLSDANRHFLGRRSVSLTSCGLSFTIFLNGFIFHLFRCL